MAAAETGALARLALRYGAWTARHWAHQPMVSCALATAGDLTAQVVGEGRTTPAELDLRRTLAFGTFGFGYSGMVIPRWFKFLASQVCRLAEGASTAFSQRRKRPLLLIILNIIIQKKNLNGMTV
jgi:hypothetical protein